MHRTVCNVISYFKGVRDGRILQVNANVHSNLGLGLNYDFMCDFDCDSSLLERRLSRGSDAEVPRYYMKLPIIYFSNNHVVLELTLGSVSTVSHLLRVFKL